MTLNYGSQNMCNYPIYFRICYMANRRLPWRVEWSLGLGATSNYFESRDDAIQFANEKLGSSISEGNR